MVSDQNLPLEAFALPGWYADLNLDYVMVVSELGVKYSEAYRALSVSWSISQDIERYRHHRFAQVIKTALRISCIFLKSETDQKRPGQYVGYF